MKWHNICICWKNVLNACPGPWLNTTNVYINKNVFAAASKSFSNSATVQPPFTSANFCYHVLLYALPCRNNLRVWTLHLLKFANCLRAIIVKKKPQTVAPPWKKAANSIETFTWNVLEKWVCSCMKLQFLKLPIFWFAFFFMWKWMKTGTEWKRKENLSGKLKKQRAGTIWFCYVFFFSPVNKTLIWK